MTNITHTTERDVTQKFLSTVFDWLKEGGEVLVVMRYLCGGGSKDYALVQTKTEFKKLIKVCPDGTDIIVFKDRQLPLRGIVDEAFITEAKNIIPDDCEYMFVELTPVKLGDPRCNGYFDYKENMEEDLREVWSLQIALGICPDFMGPDREEMISASKGGLDGPR